MSVFSRRDHEHSTENDSERIRGLQQENAALRREVNQLRGKNPMHLLGYLTEWEVCQSDPKREIAYLGDPDRLSAAESCYTMVRATFAIPKKDSEVAANMFRSGLAQKAPDSYLESMAAEKDKLSVELEKSTREKEDLLILAEKLRDRLAYATNALVNVTDQRSRREFTGTEYQQRTGVVELHLSSQVINDACVAISAGKSALAHDLSLESIRKFGESFWERHRKLERAVEEKKVEVSAKLIAELDKEDKKREW